MPNFDYGFRFSDVGDGLCKAVFINCHTNEKREITVGIDVARLVTMPSHLTSSPLVDLVDLGLATYVADRYSKRRNNARCHIHIELPVRCLEIFNRPDVVQALESCLYHYTHDHWTFSFTRRIAEGRRAERCLSLLNSFDTGISKEVALWSGGLDSLAGLYARMKGPNPADQYVLFGTGGNSIVHRVQRRVEAAARESFPAAVRRPFRLTQALIRTSGIDGIPANTSPRTRGFVFAILGAVCARFENQHQLMVYENGVGAINLRYRMSEIGLDHSRAVHPLSLEKVGNLISLVLDEPFSVINPFQFITKGQLCAPMIRDRVIDPISVTLSCDRRHRSIPTQCGRCTSCLLRRQALATHGIVEPSETYQSTVVATQGKPIGSTDSIPLNAMLAQVRKMHIAIESANPWKNLLMEFEDLSKIAKLVARQEGLSEVLAQNRLVGLYASYVAEWQDVQHVVGQELLSGSRSRAA